ncbi:hypothetical protein BJX65DRAFT_181273 [Aspergillus insuetus]
MLSDFAWWFVVPGKRDNQKASRPGDCFINITRPPSQGGYLLTLLRHLSKRSICLFFSIYAPSILTFCCSCINTFLLRGWSLAISQSHLFQLAFFFLTSHLPLAFSILIFFFCAFFIFPFFSYTWSGHFNAVMPESRTKMVIPFLLGFRVGGIGNVCIFPL